MPFENIYSFGGSQFFIGVSVITGITVSAGQINTTFKHGGGGTLWAGGPSLLQGSAYLITTGETINVNSSGTLYFVASGATSTLYALTGRSMGFEP